MSWLGLLQPLGQLLALVFVVGQEFIGILFVSQTPAHGLGARRRLHAGLDVDTQTKAVEQLRAKLALLGIHRSNQDKLRGMLIGDCLTLDPVDPGRCCIQEQVDQVIWEQVHLVHVEHSPIGTGKQPW
jgi:hypothetical protein